MANISMDPRPTNYLRQNIVFSYPEMIRVSFSLFLCLSVFCYFTLLLIFIKIVLLLLLFYLFIFMKMFFFFFFMFRDVPVFTVPLKWPMMQQSRVVPRWPVVVNSSLNRHWSTALISIELEIPPVTLSTTSIDPHVSMEWDSERWVRLQFVKRTILE